MQKNSKFFTSLPSFSKHNSPQESEPGHDPEKKSGFPWKRVLLSACALFLVLLTLLGGTIFYLISTAPDIRTISVSPEESATYICDANGTQLRKLTLASSNRDIVSLDQIPDHLQKAIIAIEDERFYEHNGIDLPGIARAFWTGITSGSFTEGASTITQQLLKNSVFTEWTQENTFKDRFTRKIQEQYLALQLEKQISKETILEDYLNTINLGAGCYGVQAAARRYFGCDVSQLTLAESAVLAAIPQNPSGYNPITNPEANQRRRSVILQYMTEQGYISKQECQDALNEDVYSHIHTYNETWEDASVYSYYEDALIDQLMSDLMEQLNYSQEQAYRAVYSGGLRIFTAQNQALQQICDEEFRNPANFPEGTEFGIDYAISIQLPTNEVVHYSSENLQTYVQENIAPGFRLLCTSEEEAGAYVRQYRQYLLAQAGAIVLGERLTLSPQPQASLVLMEQNTGYVRAIVGGRGEKTASLTLNRATDTLRQPGSTFKILTAYAPALDACGQTLATTYENEPYQYNDGTPVSNWDVNDYSGTVTIREAILRSINVVAVKCITEISPQKGYDYARKLGISTLCEAYETPQGTASDMIQPLALGGITRGVTNLELCAAYATIANQGYYLAPRFYTLVMDRHGNILLDKRTGEAHKNTDYSQNSGIGSQVLTPETAFLLTSAMEDVVNDPAGTASGTISAAGQPVAGKTGTTSDYKDIWFAGYTPYYTCCVWGGYDNNQELPLFSTAHVYNKLLWTAVMNRVHESLPTASFPKPASIVSTPLCKVTHLLENEGACPETYTEYFAQGTEPTEICSLHKLPPEPETEPIKIFEDLFGENESESESESESEHPKESETDSKAENKPDAVLPPDAENEQDKETETTIETESELYPDSPVTPENTPGPPPAPDTSSLDDFLNQLTQYS